MITKHYAFKRYKVRTQSNSPSDVRDRFNRSYHDALTAFYDEGDFELLDNRLKDVVRLAQMAEYILINAEILEVSTDELQKEPIYPRHPQFSSICNQHNSEIINMAQANWQFSCALRLLQHYSQQLNYATFWEIGRYMKLQACFYYYKAMKNLEKTAFFILNRPNSETIEFMEWDDWFYRNIRAMHNTAESRLHEHLRNDWRSTVKKECSNFFRDRVKELRWVAEAIYTDLEQNEPPIMDIHELFDHTVRLFVPDQANALIRNKSYITKALHI